MQPVDNQGDNIQDRQSQWQEGTWQTDFDQDQGTPLEQYRGPGAFEPAGLPTPPRENWALLDYADSKEGTPNPLAGGIPPAPNAPLTLYHNERTTSDSGQQVTANRSLLARIDPDWLSLLGAAAILAVVLTIGGWWNLWLQALVYLLVVFFVTKGKHWYDRWLSPTAMML